jgi:hypothetical protein
MRHRVEWMWNGGLFAARIGGRPDDDVGAVPACPHATTTTAAAAPLTMAARASERLLQTMRKSLPSSYAQLVRHTSRSGEFAASDRYDTIRQFFTRTTGPRTALHTSSTGLRYDSTYKCFTPGRTTLTHPLFPHTRLLHTSITRQRDEHNGRRSEPAQPRDKSQHAEQTPTTPTPPERPPDPPPWLGNYSAFFRRLASDHPHLHQPTRDDLLAVASGFWERLRVRFKWFTIRSFRKFNADDISAFVSLLLLSQTVWILVGT